VYTSTTPIYTSPNLSRWTSAWGAPFAKYSYSDLKSQFDAYDTDKSGAITIDELRSMYTRTGTPLSEEAIQYLMSKYDKNKDGKISFNEFYEFVHGRKYSPSTVYTTAAPTYVNAAPTYISSAPTYVSSLAPVYAKATPAYTKASYISSPTYYSDAIPSTVYTQAPIVRRSQTYTTGSPVYSQTVAAPVTYTSPVYAQAAPVTYTTPVTYTAPQATYSSPYAASSPSYISRVLPTIKGTESPAPVSISAYPTTFASQIIQPAEAETTEAPIKVSSTEENTPATGTWDRNWGAPLSSLSTAELRELFERYDRDNSGYITIDELRALYEETGTPITDSALAFIHDTYDSNQDGKLSFAEFYEFIHGTPYSA
jgi:Ca2+-binding EF-hand superfamily protein